MPINKFERNCERTTTLYTGINIDNLTNSFLIRDGGSTVIGAIDMNSNIVKKCGGSVVKSTCCNQEYYVDINSFTTAGGVVSGDIKLNVGSDFARSMGCNDLTTGTKFTLLLGLDTNMLSFSVPNSAKAFASGNIKISEMWVERLANEWIATSSPMFATAWSGFPKFSRGPYLMTFFTSSPASGWTHNFRLDYLELP